MLKDPIATEFLLTFGAAAVVPQAVPVVAEFPEIGDAITARRPVAAQTAGVWGHIGIHWAVIALLSRLEDAVAADSFFAGIRAGIGDDGIPIVAFLGTFARSIAACGSGGLQVFFHARRRTSIIVFLVPVLALFSGLEDTVAANGWAHGNAGRWRWRQRR